MNEQTTVIKKQPAAPAQKQSALMVMASRLACDPEKLLATLKSTVFRNATNEELMALTVVANAYDLNPFLKEIYAFPAKGGGIVPIVSVDGWNKMLIRHPDFDGIEFEMTEREDGTLYSCTATIHVKGRARPVKITEYYDECKRNTEPWNNMPRRMLRNRTLSQASRVAFGFSGVYNEDEAAPIIDVSTTPPPKLVQVSNSESAEPAKTVAQDPESPQSQLENFVVSEGFGFADFTKWGERSGAVPDASSFPSFSDIPTAIAKRMLNAKTGLLKGLKEGKAAQ